MYIHICTYREIHIYRCECNREIYIEMHVYTYKDVKMQVNKVVSVLIIYTTL